MPETIDSPAEQAAAPALGLSPSTLSNPVIDDSGLKAMAAKFRENYKSQVKPEVKQAGSPMPEMRQEPAKKEEAPTPAPAPEVKPDATKPAEEPAFDETKVPSIARENFKRLEQSRQEYKRQAEEGRKALDGLLAKTKELEERTKKYELAGVDPEAFIKTKEQLERETKEKEQMLAQLETINLERSPRFQNWWKTETEKHLKIAQRLVPAENSEEIRKLLLEPPSKARDAALDQIIEALPTTSKHIVTGALTQMEALKMQREEALTHGSERWRELQAHEAAERSKAELAAKQRQESLAHQALLRAESVDAFKPNPDDPEHNALIDQRKAFVRAVVQGKVDEETALSIPAAAVGYLYLQEKEIPRLKSEIAKRDELIKQLQGSAPRRSEGSAPTSQATATPQAKPGESFAARMKELWPRK